MQLVVELVDLFFGPLQRFPAGCGDSIHAPAIARACLRYLQQACALQPVQQRVQRPRSDAITMMRELLHHRQTKNRFLPRVAENMDANQAIKKFALVIVHKNQYTVFCAILA